MCSVEKRANRSAREAQIFVLLKQQALFWKRLVLDGYFSESLVFATSSYYLKNYFLESSNFRNALVLGKAYFVFEKPNLRKINFLGRLIYLKSLFLARSYFGSLV